MTVRTGKRLDSDPLELDEPGGASLLTSQYLRCRLTTRGGEAFNTDARVVSFPHREVTVTSHDSAGGRYV